MIAPPPTPNSPENRPAAVPTTASCRVRGIGRHTRGVTGPTATLGELLRPLKADPQNSAVLLDVDGGLAPIGPPPDHAHMPETTRRPLINVAKRYGGVACGAGRRAS